MKEYSKNLETGNGLFKKDGNGWLLVISRDIGRGMLGTLQLENKQQPPSP